MESQIPEPCLQAEMKIGSEAKVWIRSFVLDKADLVDSSEFNQN